MSTPAKVARVFTPDNLLRIRQMAGEGSSSVEIAKAIGSTSASVRVRCSHHKIKISRGGRSRRNAASKPVRASSGQAIMAHLPPSQSFEFRLKAEQLQIPVSVLASKLLTAIVDSNIYEAVLDDKD